MAFNVSIGGVFFYGSTKELRKKNWDVLTIYVVNQVFLLTVASLLVYNGIAVSNTPTFDRHPVHGFFGWTDPDIEPLRVRQLGIGIDTELFVHAANQVPRIDWTIRHFLSRTVGGANDVSALKAATGYHVAEAFSKVAASIIPRSAMLDFWTAAEFAAPPNDRAVEQTALG